MQHQDHQGCRDLAAIERDRRRLQGRDAWDRMERKEARLRPLCVVWSLLCVLILVLSVAQLAGLLG